MRYLIRTIVVCFVCLCATNTAHTQTQDPAILQETAKSLMRQGDYDNALQVLDKALAAKPDNIDILKDKAFTYYLQRDFANAIATGKYIISKPDADVQSYQILGLAYKAIADDKEGDKMYKAALKKFPESGVLYSEYGDLLATGNAPDLAIKQWEKGIEADPNNSSNYYYASKYYAQKGNIIWGLLYGEIFVNIESLSNRTNEIKNILYGGYQKLFSTPAILNIAKQNGTPFEKMIATNLSKLTSQMQYGVSAENLTALRTRFILNWFNSNARQFPCKLFEQQRFFLQQGMFEAYNQWLVGPVADTQQFQQWMQEHAGEAKQFQQFQRSVIFKIPTGQYYMH